MLIHLIAIAGLFLNTLGALLLLRYPAVAVAYTADGREAIQWVNWRGYRHLRRGFVAAIASFALGFALQAVDLILVP